MNIRNDLTLFMNVVSNGTGAKAFVSVDDCVVTIRTPFPQLETKAFRTGGLWFEFPFSPQLPQAQWYIVEAQLEHRFIEAFKSPHFPGPAHVTCKYSGGVTGLADTSPPPSTPSCLTLERWDEITGQCRSMLNIQ